MKLRRPAPSRFDRADGSLAVVPPLTRGQMRRLYELEQVEAGAPDPIVDASDLRAARLAIMLEAARCTDAAGESLNLKFFLESLTADEEIDIMTAMVARFHGIDPQHAVDLAAAMRELQKKKIQLNHEDVTSC